MTTDSSVSPTSIISLERMRGTIHIIRDHKVMLDRDLAILYGVKTKGLVEAVKRNIGRFPSDFMFQLTSDENARLRSQIATLEMPGRGKYSKYLPYAFTEAGVGMLSSVLRSPRAVAVNIEIVRAFITLRQFALTNVELRDKLLELEKKYDGQFKAVFRAIRELVNPEPEPRKPTPGFAREQNQIGCWPCP